MEKGVRARRGSSVILCQRGSAGGPRPPSNTHSPPFTSISGRALITAFPADCPNRPSCVRPRLFWTRLGITARDERHFQLPRQRFPRSPARPPVPLAHVVRMEAFVSGSLCRGSWAFPRGPGRTGPALK